MEEKNFLGFQPLIDFDSNILILGSFPSVKSRLNNFYYGNPQNKFWKVLASVFNEKVPNSITEKQDLCRKYKIGLWDIIISSDTIGSSDLNLEKSNFLVADIKSLLMKYPKIEKIICNGKLAFKLYKKFYSDLKINVICLPSTSPANPRFDINIWKDNLKK